MRLCDAKMSAACFFLCCCVVAVWVGCLKIKSLQATTTHLPWKTFNCNTRVRSFTSNTKSHTFIFKRSSSGRVVQWMDETGGMCIILWIKGAADSNVCNVHQRTTTGKLNGIVATRLLACLLVAIQHTATKRETAYRI